MIQAILVPLDGSTDSERALPVSCELAKALKAQLVLVCVAGEQSKLGQSFTDQDRQTIRERYAGVKEEEHLLSTDPKMIEHAQIQVRAIAEAETYLERVACRLAKDGVQIKTAIPYGPAAEGILTEIDLYSAGLVVMATRGRSRISRMINGSVTQAVLANSPAPVLLVPPGRKKTAVE